VAGALNTALQALTLVTAVVAAAQLHKMAALALAGMRGVAVQVETPELLPALVVQVVVLMAITTVLAE
jgi:hypothetical protein